MNREAEQLLKEYFSDMLEASLSQGGDSNLELMNKITKQKAAAIDRLVIEGRIQEIKLQQEKHYKPGSRIARLSALLSQSSQPRADLSNPEEAPSE